MPRFAAGSLLAYLAGIPDPRGRKGRRHTLAAMLAAVVSAILCGARGYTAIAQWIKSQEPATWHRLGFWRKPPTTNAFRDLLLQLSPELLEAALQAWVQGLVGLSAPADCRPLAVDGKTLRHTITGHDRNVHLLAILDRQLGCVLSQQAVDTKTNEHKAALELLQGLVLQGRVISGDAMFCQRDLCQQIVDSGGDYFFVVKDNQPSLREAIAAEFQPGFSPLQRA